MSFLISLSEIPRKPDTYFRSAYTVVKNISNVPSSITAKAIHNQSQDKVIVRILPRASSASERDTDLLRTEISVLSKLSHPGLPTLLEYFCDIRNYYVVLHMYHGNTLHNKLIGEQSFDEARCVFYMREIAYMLEFLYQHRIVYRAVNLEEIVLSSKSPDAVLKFVGFFYSKVIAEGEVVRTKVGIPCFMAPEVLRQEYDCRSDWWSAGVLLYMMLSGTIPFSGSNDSELTRKIRAADVRFPNEAWRHVGEVAKDLIRRLLTVDPNERITPAEVLAHPWLNTPVPRNANPEVPAGYFRNLINFKTANMLRKNIFRHMSNMLMNSAESSEILELFCSLDTNKDGQLSKAEIREGFLRIYGNRIKNLDEYLERVFGEVDFDGSGELSYEEFLMAVGNKERLMARENLEAVFHMLDTNQSGTLEFDEFRELVTNSVGENEESVKKMFSECDLNRDGKVSLNEFCSVMMALPIGK
jgi:calcium-dependent protein kinase